MNRYFFIRYYLLITMACLAIKAYAQREGNIWYFGNHAGIDFNTGAPFALTDGAMSAVGGCATISNAAGKLLFYTDGRTVYDRNNTVMPNGSGLAGGFSSTQSAIIIPKPFSTNLYYIFTVDYEMGPKGLEYSIVDMTKHGGNGDVVTKNTFITRGVCEKLTAVQHANKIDVWVIAHDSIDGYLAYLVNDSGVRTKPVISKGGVNVSGNQYNAIGYLKVSSGGTKLASAVKFLNLIEIGDFDNTTGKITNLKTLPNINTPYGLEFSPDNTKLYATNYQDNKLYQFNLASGDISNIINSMVTIFTSTNALSAIQQAPDGKLYVSRDARSQIGVISYPNLPGTACGYVEKGFDLSGKICYSGLPTFVQSFFIPVTDYVYRNTCFGDSTYFIGKTNTNPLKWYWNFGDPVSTYKNTDSAKNPVHVFSAPGFYTVIMVITLNGINDTIKKSVEISDVPKVNLGPDQTTCLGNPIGLEAGSPLYKYLWNTGDTIHKINVDSSGKYWVTASKGSCTRSDTINLTFISIGNYKLGNDTVLCVGSALKLSKNIKGAHILWSTGETDTTISVTKTGYYWVRVSLGSCTVYDSILVFFDHPPVIDLGPDKILCEGDTLTLDTKIKNGQYLWSTGETTQKIKIHQGGNYWARVKSTGCFVFDTIKISHCRAIIFIPDIFSPNGDSLNDRFRPVGSDIARAKFTIINRWGEVVYQSDNIIGWDGKFKGKPCPGGLYAYVLVYREYLGDVLYDRQITGKFYLAR